MTNRTLTIIVLTISGLIVAGLFWLIYGFDGFGDSDGLFAFLPAFNAACNALSALCVVAGLIFIKRGSRTGHGICMISATLASAAFLVGYITHHSLHGDTLFTGQGWVRPVYFALLISHILLSVAVVPLILLTLLFAALRRWPAHRAIARWTYPVWLYVSITGVLVFFFLRVWFV